MGLLACLAVMALDVHAQTFHKTLGTPTVNEYGQCLQASPDGNFFVGGAKGDSALIIKVDPAGQVLWSRCLRPIPSYRNIIFHIAQAPDGNMIATGNGQEAPSLGYGHTFILKFDLSGNILWITRPPVDRPIWTHRTLPVSPSEYLLLTEIYDMSSPTWPDLFTARLDAATGALIGHGPLLDYIPYNSYIDDIRCATLGLGGNVYIGGRIYLNGSAPSGMRPFITKFDAAGNELWSKYLMFHDSQSARVYGSDIAFTGDSLILCYYGNLTGAAATYSAGLIRTDTLGNVAWTKDYKIQGYSSAMAFAVMQMPYGYALAGYANNGNDKDLFTIATDHTGEVLWARKFGTPSTVEDLYQPFTPHAMAIGDNILLTGSKQTGNNTDILLARMDQNGDIACLNGAPLTIQTTNVPPFSTVLSPQPIPHQITMAPVNTSASSPGIEDQCSAIGLELGPDTTICGTAQLDATTPNATYTWSTGSHDPSIEVDAPGSYWVQVTVDCCVYTDTITILPGLPPTASFSLPTSTCGQEITLINNSDGATSYLWDFGDGSTSTEADPVHEYAGAGTYSISLTAINACGSDTGTQTLEVNGTGTLSINGPDTLCEGGIGNFSISLSGVMPESILWSTGETTLNIELTGTTPVLLWVDVEDENGCTYTSELSVQISPQPTAAFQFNALRCDTSITFQDASTDATSWHWNLGNGQSSQLSSPTGNYPGIGTYNVQLVAGNACGTDTMVQELVLGPEGTLILAGPDSLCTGETGTYTVTLQGATLVDVEWWPMTWDQDVMQSAFDEDTQLGVSATDDQHCRYTASMFIQVLPPPEVDFTVQADPCDSVVALHSTSVNSNLFLWDLGNGNTSQAYSPQVAIPAGDTLLITLIGINTCGADTMKHPAWTEPAPELLLLAPERICSHHPITLILAYPGGLANIHWSTGDSTMATTVVPVEGGTISVSALSDDGCPLTASFTVHFSGDDGRSPAYAPNVFTPNGDGINEVFMPVVAEGFRSLMIFNRWGELIHETSDPYEGWRGDHRGKPVPDGTYVYILSWHDACTDLPQETIGHVTLLR